MSMTINHNAMAQNAYRNLSTTYGKLSTSTERMSSGLRVNSAADDAAGLAIREMMRADITTTQQGIRNAADAISMLQTADGSLGIIDEKLIRMKELAEQAATGTYTTVQREIINSEYQAMAAEIDRIANATEFNGIKLLDGSVSSMHGGRGIKVHFGVSNDQTEDYYFVNIADSRATSSTGLRVGGDAKNDIWSQGGSDSGPLAGPGCCTAGFPSLNGDGGFADGQSFSYGYNWDWTEDDDTELLSGKYLAGRYTVDGGESLQDLVEKVNLGTQSRVGIQMNANGVQAGISAGGTVAICVGDEAYVFGSATIAEEGGQVGEKVTATVSVNGKFGLGSAETEALTAAGINVGQLKGFKDLSVSNTSAEVDADLQTKTQDELANALAAQGVTSGLTVTDTHETGDVVTDAEAYGFNTTVRGTAANDGLALWTDNKGNFTSSEIVADLLDFQQVVITINGAQQDVIAKLEDGTTLANFSLKTSGGGATSVTGSRINGALNEAMRLSGGDRAAGKIEISGLSTTEVGNIKKDPVTTGPVVDAGKQIRIVAQAGDDLADFGASALAASINTNTQSEFWAMTEGDSMVYVFAKDGGDKNSLKACDVGGPDEHSVAARDSIKFEKVDTGEMEEAGTSFTLGGEDWAKMIPKQSQESRGYDVWNVTLEGRDVGLQRDLWIASEGEIDTPGMNVEELIHGLNREAFIEVQNADDVQWAGAEVRTQSSAQEALDALTHAVIQKDKTRADIGALQNRLENTMSNLEIQTENLMASESRISDVDVAKEMTEFTKNNVMVQAATSMLSQANGMSQMALSLMG